MQRPFLLALMCLSIIPVAEAAPSPLTLSWEKNYLTIHGPKLPGGTMQIHYIEAYCRPGSTDADWVRHTKIPHKSELLERSDDGRILRLRCTLESGVTMDHTITAGQDEVDFRVTAHNPTDKASDVHWAQPCVRVGEFSGTGPKDTQDKYAYIRKSFIFLDGKLAMMPTKDWATQARYLPGQVWRPRHVPADDVNPRPVNPHHPSNGLIGCFSGDNRMIFATAWEPYQELFQGVIRCLHSDFHIGGLQPGETRQIRGKIYFVPNDVPALLHRYQRDFPEHH